MSYDPEVIRRYSLVPPGKVRLCEYGQEERGSMCLELVLDTHPTSATPGKHPVTLIHRTRGYVPAGSCLRWNDVEVWGVRFFDARSNTTYGQWYLTKEEAEGKFASVSPTGKVYS